ILEAKCYGTSIATGALDGTSNNTARLRSGKPSVLTRKPNNTTTATISGATQIERFSHNSRRTDQWNGRVGDADAGAIACESICDPGMLFDGLFISLLLVCGR